jgi:hypothetical protein
LQQVHGVDVLTLDAGNVLESNGAAFDACVTGDAGVVCTIMVADCLPVLLAHDSGLVVGAAHAGWRGLAGMPPGRQQSEGRCPAVCWRCFSSPFHGKCRRSNRFQRPT